MDIIFITLSKPSPSEAFMLNARGRIQKNDIKKNPLKRAAGEFNNHTKRNDSYDL